MLPISWDDSTLLLRGVDNFLGLGGLISKDKRDAMLPPAQSAETKFFFQNPRGVREQITILICTEGYGFISFEDSGFCTETSSTSLSNYIFRIH